MGNLARNSGAFRFPTPDKSPKTEVNMTGFRVDALVLGPDLPSREDPTVHGTSKTNRAP